MRRLILMTVLACVAVVLAGRSGAEPVTVKLGGGVTMDLVRIPAGNYMMGRADTAHLDEKPCHPVNISSFYMGRFEVTQEQWAAVMGDEPSVYKGPQFPNSKSYPVDNVSWNYCKQFFDALNQMDLPFEFRFPTEAEWEYACRAGSTTVFSFGDEPDACGDYAWFSPNAGSQTRPVGSKQPNAWGLYDMHGNVWEWCDDLYKAYPGGTLPNGCGDSGMTHVLRGGAYNSMPERLSSSYRHELEPYYGDRCYGFRCAAVLRDPSESGE